MVSPVKRLGTKGLVTDKTNTGAWDTRPYHTVIESEVEELPEVWLTAEPSPDIRNVATGICKQLTQYPQL